MDLSSFGVFLASLYTVLSLTPVLKSGPEIPNTLLGDVASIVIAALVAYFTDRYKKKRKEAETQISEKQSTIESELATLRAERNLALNEIGRLEAKIERMTKEISDLRKQVTSEHKRIELVDKSIITVQEGEKNEAT